MLVGVVAEPLTVTSESEPRAMMSAVDEKKNLANLSKYAKEMKLYTRVMNVMEVLLNG